MLVHNNLHLILNIVGIMFITNQVYATSCQVHPSEYAYKDNSVTRSERTNSANCRRYPPGPQDGGVYREDYIRCDGTQLKLTDSIFGSLEEQYQSSEYYWWSADSIGQLLFIFPTRVSLTTITLHYYSDSHRGLPRLRLYAVPDDFNVWDAPSTSYPQVDVASVSSGEPVGHMNVRITVIFNNINKVLMYKFRSSDQFALSEAEFFKCQENTYILSSIQTGSDFTINPSTTANNFATTIVLAKSMSTIHYSATTETKMVTVASKSTKEIITTGVSIVILLILSTIIIVIVVVLIWIYKRRAAKQKLYTECSYSTLSRGSVQVQPQSTQQTSAGLYDQIHLSPSTGQTEFIPKPQRESINNPLHNSHPTHPDAENYVTSSAESQTNPPPAIYATVDKNKRKVKKDESDTEHFTASEKKGPLVSSYAQNLSSTTADKGAHIRGKDDPMNNSQKSLDDMYASDHKDQEKVNRKQESNLYSDEELYTAVKKKPKDSVPVNEPISHRVEDLYTAVMKKSRESSTDSEAALPIPSHTIEQLYTAVQKKPKGNVMEDEEEAPPIPPHTVEDTY